MSSKTIEIVSCWQHCTVCSSLHLHEGIGCDSQTVKNFFHAQRMNNLVHPVEVRLLGNLNATRLHAQSMTSLQQPTRGQEWCKFQKKSKLPLLTALWPLPSRGAIKTSSTTILVQTLEFERRRILIPESSEKIPRSRWELNSQTSKFYNPGQN